VLEINDGIARSKSITVQTQMPSAVAPIMGDVGLIGQVVLNFFSNAVKYSDTGKTVRVILQDRGSVMYCAVQDEGYGIAPSDQEKLFSKFFRATGDVRVRDNVGTGLGLAFVKEIIEKHGGELGVDSKLNEGSTFWFTLPK
jgi:signal transduction histidine kinase